MSILCQVTVLFRYQDIVGFFPRHGTYRIRFSGGGLFGLGIGIITGCVVYFAVLGFRSGGSRSTGARCLKLGSRRGIREGPPRLGGAAGPDVSPLRGGADRGGRARIAGPPRACFLTLFLILYGLRLRAKRDPAVLA